jgi:hypothetical protein
MIKILSASKIAAADITGTSDPYCVLRWTLPEPGHARQKSTRNVAASQAETLAAAAAAAAAGGRDYLDRAAAEGHRAQPSRHRVVKTFAAATPVVWQTVNPQWKEGNTFQFRLPAANRHAGVHALRHTTLTIEVRLRLLDCGSLLPTHATAMFYCCHFA